MDSFKLIEKIDYLRRQKKINVKDFCKGICSTRNYSRYLSYELSLPFDTFVLLVERLGYSIKDFVIIVENEIMEKNIQFVYFLEYVRNGLFNEAENVLSKVKLTDVPFNIKNIHFPIAYEIFKFKQNQTSYAQFYSNCLKILNLKKLFQSELLSKEEAEALVLFLPYAKDEDKEEIFLYLYNYLVDRSQKLLSATIEITLSRVAIGLLEYIFTTKDKSKLNYAKNLVVIAQRFIIRDSLESFIVQILFFYSNIHMLNNELDLYNKVYKYMLALIFTRDERNLILNSINFDTLSPEEFYNTLFNNLKEDQSIIDCLEDNYGKI